MILFSNINGILNRLVCYNRIEVYMSKANGKIILFGEHSVLYGGGAIGLRLKKTYVEVKISKNNYDYIESSFYSGRIENIDDELNPIKSLYLKLKEKFKMDNSVLNIKTNIPLGSGLGSSAALAKAITEEIFKYNKKELEKKELLMWIDYSESIAHGKASGVDARICTSDKPIFFKKGKYRPLDFNFKGVFLAIFSNMKKSTKNAVNLIKENSSNVKNIIMKISNNSDLALEAIKNGDLEKIGNLMTKGHKLLKKLGVSNNVLDNMVRIAIQQGAFGAKLTGSGLGGCIIVLCNERTSSLISKKFLKEGFKIQFREVLQ